MRKPTLTIVLLTLVGGLVLAGCGSKSTAGSTTTPSKTGTTVHVAIPVRSTPSVSARMICSDDVKTDLFQLLGVKNTNTLDPTWIDHVYSCKYVYPNGTLTLSVKELADKEQTDAYFAARAKELGKTQTIQGLGQGAFTTKNLSAVVRKDYKVLTVDISGLPAQFGTPPDSRADVALNVAATIMGCWTGA